MSSSSARPAQGGSWSARSCAQALRVESRRRPRCVVVTDIEIALAAAFADGPGIVVSAGTGSVAVGRDKEGARHRIGGYGWQMGDEGSGYAIGRAALGAVSRAPTDAAHAPRSVTGCSPRRGARTSTRSFAGPLAPAPAEVAAIAPHVLDVAEQGDTLAKGIADYAARELSQLAICLFPKMEFVGKIGVAITGGLLSADGLLRRSVLAMLRGEEALEPIEKPVDAVHGALRLAGAQ